MEEHLQMEPARSSPLKQTCGHRPCGAEAGRGGTAPTAAPGQAPLARDARAAPPPRDGARVADIGARSGRPDPSSRAGPAEPARPPPRGWKRGHLTRRKGTQGQRRAPTPRCAAGTTLRRPSPRRGRGRRPPGGCHGHGRVPASPPAAGTAPGRGAIARPSVPSSGERQRLFFHRFTSIKTSRSIIYKRT